MLLAGGGSSDVIFTVLMSGITKEMTVLILDPMYGEYQHVLEHVIGAKVVRHHLRESEAFAVDTDESAGDSSKSGHRQSSSSIRTAQPVSSGSVRHAPHAAACRAYTSSC